MHELPSRSTILKEIACENEIFVGWQSLFRPISELGESSNKAFGQFSLSNYVLCNGNVKLFNKNFTLEVDVMRYDAMLGVQAFNMVVKLTDVRGVFCWNVLNSRERLALKTYHFDDNLSYKSPNILTTETA